MSIENRRSYLREYGYTLKEIAAHMKVNTSRVYQLIAKGSPRIRQSVMEMKRRKR
jgi:DNA-directed RNA polymerase specialized sigma subunit